ncbi:MAG: Lrp/AsnC family transcriptional regulator [Chloroflexi bacterium]|nr:Lrp/AsnC family transcriptional regulator [Chloroflexota bacterium]
MVKYLFQIDLDELDIAILHQLQENGRISNVDLSKRVNLSPPAIHTRIKRLEQQGIIRRTVTLLDWAKMGFDMLCFIQINLQAHQPKTVENFRSSISKLPEVLECHHVTGDYDYLLKVAIRNREDLERFVVKQITPIPGIARIQTSLSLNEIKSTTSLPING